MRARLLFKTGPPQICLAIPSFSKNSPGRSPSPYRDHSLIDLSRQPDIVQVVLPDFCQLPCVVKIEHAASVNLFGLTRLQTQCPRQIIEAHAISGAEPPAQHSVEDASRIVLAYTHEG